MIILSNLIFLIKKQLLVNRLTIKFMIFEKNFFLDFI